MRRPQEIDALVAHFGARAAVTETEDGWWSSCPVPAASNGDGPVFCSEKMFVTRLDDGGAQFEPICGHTAEEIMAVLEEITAAPAKDASMDNGRMLPPPTEPMKVARVLTRERY